MSDNGVEVKEGFWVEGFWVEGGREEGSESKSNSEM
jgi:hypothetical protein